MTLVITGAAGLVGEVLRRELSAHYEVRGIDKHRVRGDGGVARTNMLNRRSVEAAFRDAELVVDLAAFPEADAPWKVVWKNNIGATMNAFAAADAEGVRRFVFASSNRVTGGYESDWPYSAIVAGSYDGLDPAKVPMIDSSTAIRPDGVYALGKVLGEAAARYYADARGLSAVCLRLGTVNSEDRPLAPRHYATWLSHRDLTSLVTSALEAPPTLRFGVYYGVSDNTWRFWDVSRARDELGFEPRDNAEHFRREPLRSAT
jgi:nucleoside-diphosphate-sugar epimerase